MLLLSFTLYSCGKKETAGDKPKDEKTTTGEKTETNTSSGEGVKIVFDMTGPVGGSMTMYREGKNFKTEMKQSVAGQNMENTMISDGDWVYIMVDMMGQSQAMKMKLDKYKDGSTTNDVDYMNIEENLDKYEKVGTETILGKECDIYKINESAKISVYDKKYPLKISTKEMTMTAKEFSETDVPDSMFKVPEGVNFKEMEAPNLPGGKK